MMACPPHALHAEGASTKSASLSRARTRSSTQLCIPSPWLDEHF